MCTELEGNTALCCAVKGWMFVPRCNRLQLEWFVIAPSVELGNLHHPCYLDRHHWVVHFIWGTHTDPDTHMMNGQRIQIAHTLK